MSAIQLRVAGTGLSFLAVLLSGFWLSRSGKPLNVVILTVHKLVSLTTIAFLVAIIAQAYRVAPLGTIELTASVITGVFFLGTILSGGLLSTGKPIPAIVLRMHQILPFLTLFSTAVTLYLLLNRK